MQMKIIEDYEICYPNPLNLKVGDAIQLFEKSTPEKWRGWHWCRDTTGNEGWISQTYFQRTNNTATIVKDYTAKELTVRKDDQVKVVYNDCGWAWCRAVDGEEGWIPCEIFTSDI